MSIISIEEILTALVIQDMQSTERAVQLLGPLLLQSPFSFLQPAPSPCLQPGPLLYLHACGVNGILDVAICHLAGFKTDISFFYLLHNPNVINISIASAIVTILFSYLQELSDKN